MEFRYLVAFLAIAEELHFGRAAARLHLAQPSLSQQLQRLERAVGVRLVDRSSHGVRLTAAGLAFRPEAQRLLGQSQRAIEVARAAAGGAAGTVRIGFNYPAGRLVLPPTLDLLRRRHPLITTTLAELRTGPSLQAMANCELDVAFIYGPPDDPTLGHRRVVQVPVVALVGPDHPWAGRGQVRCAELAGQRCVTFRRQQSPAMHEAVLAAAQRGGVTLDVVDKPDDPTAVEIIVGAEAVVTFASAVRAASGTPSTMRAVRLVDPVPMLDIHLVWRVDHREPALGQFLDAVAAAGPFALVSSPVDRELVRR